MDIIWNYLFIFGILIGLYMVFYSIYTIAKEKKHIRNTLAPDEQLPSWYASSIIRKHVGLLSDGVLAVVVSVGLTLYLKHVAFAFLLIAVAVFLRASSTLVGTIVECATQTKITRGTGERHFHCLGNSHFHQGIAIALFLTGVGISILLTGLVSIKTFSFGMVDQIAWLWEIFIFVGGFYGLTVYTIQIVQKRKRRA